MRLTAFHRWGALCGVTAAALAGARAGHSLQANPEGSPALPPLLIEDFEAAALGSRPYLWKEGKSNIAGVTIGSERVELDGVKSNKALKYEYSFAGSAAANQGAEAGPQGQPLPGSLSAVTMMVHGDSGKHNIALRVEDRDGESFEWQVPVTWTGWRKVSYPMNPKNAFRGGSKANGAIDLPIKLEGVRLVRTATGARKGEVMVDNLTATCTFGKVETLYDASGGAKPEGWKANRVRSVLGTFGETLVPRGADDVPVLKMEYEYEFGADSQVEFTKTLPTTAGGHGTLIAEIFGDGSNNIMRLRMLDGADKPWQAAIPTILVDWSGWKTIYLDTRFLRGVEGNDPTGMMDRFPAKFYSIIVDDASAKDNLPGVESGRKGEIFLGRVLFAAEK